MRQLPSTRSGRRWVSIDDQPFPLWLAMEMDDSSLSPFGPWSAFTPRLPRGLILDLRLSCLSSLALESGQIRILPGSVHPDAHLPVKLSLRSLSQPGDLVLVLGKVADRRMHSHLIEATAAAHRLGAIVLVALYCHPSERRQADVDALIQDLAVHADRILFAEPVDDDALHYGSALDYLAWTLSAGFAPAMLDFILAPAPGPMYVNLSGGGGPNHRLDAIDAVLASRPNRHAAEAVFIALADGQYGKVHAGPSLLASLRQRLPPGCVLELHHQPGHNFTGAASLAFQLMRGPASMPAMFIQSEVFHER